MPSAIADTRTSRVQIDEFLAQKRLALVGASRNDRDFSRMLMRELVSRGYEVIPVNPGASEIGGRPCAARVQDVQPPVSAALLMTTPAVADQIVQDCAAAGVTHVWLYRAGGQGAVSAEAVAFCREHGINVVAGECPFMFLPNSAFFHRIHGWIRMISGNYPR